MVTTEEKEVTDILWEEMKNFAVEQQQCLYELLSEYRMYKSNEYKYLKQNIGYALYGPPEGTNDASEIENCSYYCKTEDLNVTDVTDKVVYKKEQKEVIDKIYDKICSCAVESDDDSQSICFGIIYNMIFALKTDVKPKKKEEKKTEKETKEEEKQEMLGVGSLPIFKIIKSIQEKSKITKSTKEEDAAKSVEIEYETWYIDTTARVYKNWVDYTEKNNLPKCTMVLPKDGVYQPNRDYTIADDYSTVWLEIMESPACSWTNQLVNGIDIATNAVSLGGIGLGIASLFTPLAPVLAVSGLAAAGVTGAWSLGRNFQQLIDRSVHEESINVFDKEVVPHYLSIAGTTLGLGVVGGSVIISNVAARGMTVNTLARVVFNTTQGGNLIINGIGILYQGYNMKDKYKKEKTVSLSDALNLATHLMFFCGSVVKVQFASDIIESTQGRVMNEYKKNLSTKRLRYKYNRATRRAAQNNVCKMSENAEVIRYIRNRQELLSTQSVTNVGKVHKQTLDNTPCNVLWSFEHGRLMVNGTALLDPIEYVTRLIKLGKFFEVDQNRSSGSLNHDNSIADQLARVLCDLLSKIYRSNDCPRSNNIPRVSDYEPLIRELSSMHFNEAYLKKLFEIAVKLMRRSKNMDDFLFQSVCFVWQYCKANLKQWGMSLCYTQSVSSKLILKKIITAIFEAIDMVLNNLSNAFMLYMKSSLNRNQEE